jgi:hypothetical protein
MDQTIKNTHVDYMSRVARAARANGIIPIIWDDGGNFRLLQRSNGRPASGLFMDVLTEVMNAINNTQGPDIPIDNEHYELTIGDWTWGTYDDKNEGGASKITMTQLSDSQNNRLKFSGNIVKQAQYDGFVGWYAIPNFAVLTALKAAQSFSFKIIGDGKTYAVHVLTSDVTDNCNYQKTISTQNGQEQTVTINLQSGANDLQQPNWGNQVSFNKNNIRQIQIQTQNASGQFEVTVWDIALNNPTPVGKAKKSDKLYGIRFAENIVSDKAQISIVLPNNEKPKDLRITVYDMTGNAVYSCMDDCPQSPVGEIVWYLRNSAGRLVANGGYLVVAEAKDEKGKTHVYSAKIGVKR